MRSLNFGWELRLLVDGEFHGSDVWRASKKNQVDWQGHTVRLDPVTTKSKEGRTLPFTAALETLLKAQTAEHYTRGILLSPTASSRSRTDRLARRRELEDILRSGK